MIIVDASVAMKWLNKDESDSDLAFFLYKNHFQKKEGIIIPNLLFIEAANALATAGVKSEKDIRDGISFLFRSDFEIQTITENDLIEASLLAKKYKTSVYDMIYSVIAKNKKRILVTADENFVRKTKFKHVKLLKELEKKLS